MDEKDIVTAFRWPNAKSEASKQERRELFKNDGFLEHIEQLVIEGQTWAPVLGSTRRVEPIDKVQEWIRQQFIQKELIEKSIGKRIQVSLKVEDFPLADQSCTITTSRKQVYLLNTKELLLNALRSCFLQRSYKELETVLKGNLAVCLFKVDTITSAFREDPYTGQIATYNIVFCRDMDNTKSRYFIVYYPHQLFSQFFNTEGTPRDCKHVKALRHLCDIIITASGVIIEPSKWEIID